MEIDHIYICTDEKAPAGDLLKEFGLTEGSSNTHPGQGTANRRFYFHNFMLEFLWVDDVDEVQNYRTMPMRLYERCISCKATASPFGIAFRPTVEKDEEAPFPVWDYHPAYLPDFLKIQVAGDTPLSEPMYFYLFFATRQDKALQEKREPMEHNAGLRELTSVKIHVKHNNSLSEAACLINKLNNISIIPDNEHFIELYFNSEVLNQTKDFRPHLPLIFRW